MQVKHFPGFLVILCLFAMTTTTFAWADVSTAPAAAPDDDKIRAVAAMYADVFESQQAVVSNHKTQQAQAVKLLMMSFRDATSVDELSMALKTQDAQPFKSDADIKILLTQHLLTWDDYQQVLSAVSSDSKSFDTFKTNVDIAKLQKVFLDRVSQNPSLLATLPEGPQKAIICHFVQKQAPSGVPVAGK